MRTRTTVWQLPPCIAVAVLALPSALGAQVTYDVSFPNAAHHEAIITFTLSGLPPEPIQVLMSRASPGRYALHEFAKNVYGLTAVDGAGRPLTVTRTAPSAWEVGAHDGTVRVTYTLYGDMGDGTYAQIDPSHAHLNMPATFLWVRGHEQEAIRVRFQPPAGSGWKIATQLVPGGDPHTFTAPDLQYFMDSPTELSDYTERAWVVRTAGRADTLRMAVHHQGSEGDVDGFVDAARRIVHQAAAVFGELPPFDHGTYTFIADYLPWMSGDGMEHRNSTILTSRRNLGESAPALLGTVAHEFFHAWNVERMRPRALEPFDFERANMSGELWFAEGFTSYYGPLLMIRAGLIDLPAYARGLADGVSHVVNAPGRRLGGPVDMSRQAPLVDAATSVDPTNEANTFVSYYTWGAVLGLALDLTLRSRFELSLDGFMRLLWQRHGVPEIPYTLENLEVLLSEYTADRAFAADFFDRFVRGRDVPELEPLLARAGLDLRREDPGEAFLGSVLLAYDDAGATLVSAPEIGSALYAAGLDRGDVILRLAGGPLRSDEDWRRVLSRRRPGDVLEIVFTQRGFQRTAALTVAANPRLAIVPIEALGRDVSPAARAFREDWLGARP
jgi:predicted metalloprotease with PDZ domain